MIAIHVRQTGREILIHRLAIGLIEVEMVEDAPVTIVRTLWLHVGKDPKTEALVAGHLAYDVRETPAEIQALLDAEEKKHTLEAAITQSAVHSQFLDGWLEKLKAGGAL